MSEFFNKIAEFFQQTHVIQQVREVDYVGLFTNPWFLVPFLAVVGYMIFKKAWRDIVIFAIFITIWWASGTEYMHTLIIGENLQIGKILPVLGGGAVAVALIIYLLFGRSD